MSWLALIHWSARPELFEFGPFAVRWYGVFFAAGFYLGYLLVRWMYQVEGKPEEALSNLLVYVVIGSLVGARLVHCFLYEPDYYLRHPLEILKVWEGGLASHGGALGVLLVLGWHARRHPDQPFLWLLDRAVVPTALAGALIRTGNLFNSEILGRPADVPWAFVFTRVDAVPRHPVQLYEAAAYLLTFGFLLWLYRRGRARTPQGLLTGCFLVLIFAARFALEFFKEHQATYEANFAISVGQWLSVPFIVAGCYLLWRTWRSPCQPALNKPSQ